MSGAAIATSFTLSAKPVGPGHPSLVVAEVAQAHDGSLGTAHAYIDAIAATGASAVKFQTHIADAESTPREPFRVQTFPQDATRYDYWKRMEFTTEQWARLAAHAEAKGLIFLSTPFSTQALELLERLGMPAWKVGSGEITNLPMLELMARTGKPVLLSSGMSTWSELDDAIECVSALDAPVAVMQCTTSYPCPPEQLGLNVLEELRERYGCPVGLSDHSGTIFASLAAVTLGANLIEVHTVLSKDCFGPDVTSSVTTLELAELVDGARFIERALGAPVSKDEAAEARSELRELFGKSLVAARDLNRRHRLTADDVVLKKPGVGIPARRLRDVVGRVLLRDYTADEFIDEGDLE